MKTRQTIFLTGATGLLGKEICTGFIEKDVNLVITTRDISRVPKKWRNNVHITIIEADLMTKEGLRALIDRINLLEIKLTDLIFNARNLDFLKIEQNGESKEINIINEFRLAVTVPYQIINAFLENEQDKLKNIVFITSIYGVVGPNKNLYDNVSQDSPIQYGIAKSAQIHMAKELAIRLSNHSINVNSVSFGGFKGRASTKFENKYNLLNPQHRMLEPEEAFGVLDFLTSESAKGITGENIKYDSGWTIW